MKTLEKVLEQLPFLTKEELVVVQQTVAWLQAGESEKDKGEGVCLGENTDAAQRLYVATLPTLKRFGIYILPWHVFAEAPYFQDSIRKTKRLLEWTDRTFPSLTPKRRRALYRIYAVVLARWLANHQYYAASFHGFWKRIDQIPELLVKAFPGYAEQGWLPLILDIGKPTRETD